MSAIVDKRFQATQVRHRSTCDYSEYFDVSGFTEPEVRYRLKKIRSVLSVYENLLNLKTYF